MAIVMTNENGKREPSLFGQFIRCEHFNGSLREKFPNQSFVNQDHHADTIISLFWWLKLKIQRLNQSSWRPTGMLRVALTHLYHLPQCHYICSETLTAAFSMTAMRRCVRIYGSVLFLLVLDENESKRSKKNEKLQYCTGATVARGACRVSSCYGMTSYAS